MTSERDWTPLLAKIPPISPLAHRLLSLQVDDDDAFDQLENVIASDPPLAAKILGISNASLYAPSGSSPCVRVSQCLQRLGLHTAWEVALGYVFGSSLRTEAELHNAKQDLWVYSYCTACAAQLLAQHSRVPGLCRSLAFMVGFLHALAWLPLMMLDPRIARGSPWLESLDRVAPALADLELPPWAEVQRQLVSTWQLPQALGSVLLRQGEVVTKAQVSAAAGSMADTAAYVLLLQSARDLTRQLLDAKTPEIAPDERWAVCGLEHEQVLAVATELQAKLESLRATARMMSSG